MKKIEVKPGRMVRITRGEYSSYETLGWFVCVQPFCAESELAEFLTSDPKLTEQYCFSSSEFLAYLLRKGLLAECADFFDEWFLGGYGNAKEVSYTPMATNAP